MPAFTVTGPTSTALVCAPADDHIARALKKGVYYEAGLLNVIGDLAATGTFVDVGACFGNHTAYFAVECGADRIVAVESSPTNLAYLAETVAANGLADRATVIHAAVHNLWANVMVIPASDGGNAGMASVAEHGTIQAVRLDDLLADEKQVGFIKIDTEGLSAEALQSGRETIRKHRPALAVETIDQREQQHVFNFLWTLGYGPPVGSYCATPVWLWR